jgi:zinc protease
MKSYCRINTLGIVIVIIACSSLRLTEAAQYKKDRLFVPVAYYKLSNGLKVVLSQDKTAPTVVVAVYYKIGFRNEPKARTGFAHLFEHLMFQGSQNLGKMEFIKLVEQNGGILNGSTTFDFTEYFEVVPAHKLETALWAEADRMRGLKITDENLKNQQGVVSNEVKVNVLNTPYGGFPWLDVPQYANSNWHNSHNFYGDLKDIEAASLADAQDFFKKYYAPNNAVLVVTGDFEIVAARKMIEHYFRNIPPASQPPPPDVTEPRQVEEKRFSKGYPLANRPALGFGYHMPPRNTPEYYAMGLLDRMLIQGENSLLYQELVKHRGYTGGLEGGINQFGNMFNYDGPMLWIVNLFHDSNVSADQILASVDRVIERIQLSRVDQRTIDLAIVRIRSFLYDYLTQFGGVGRADLLACFALFDDKPQHVNSIEREFRKVTPEVLQRTAREYLRTTNRTVLTIEPGRSAN